MARRATLLVGVDGSAASLRALKFACARFKAGGYAQLVALNVQAPIQPSRHLTSAAIHAHQHHAAEAVLDRARAVAARHAITLVAATACADPATAIAGFARKAAGDEIVLGGPGSTASRVLLLADVPVTLVK
jgi:nucleotide-binding universal stress UspA family protein